MESGQTLNEVIEQLQNVDLQVTKKDSYEHLHMELAANINYLITNNFSLLISILYRLDISEQKINEFLSQSKGTTAGDIISTLIIERQLEKIASKKAFTNRPSDIPYDEQW